MNTPLKYTFIIILAFLSSRLSASPQMPDYVIYGKDTIATFNLILEQYLQKQEPSKTEKLFGLSFRNGASFNCWRGYQAIYKIENDSLYLVDIINCGERRHINKVQSAEKMKAIFGDRLVNGKVFINWFSGYINFPLTNKMLRWDGVFYRIFEKEKVINITDGKVNKVEDVENYVDDPKRINRKDKDKISDILFKKLKKAKWKNTEEFDCSNKYIVTIDENGDISKVKIQSETDDNKGEVDEEDAFCVNKVYNALKTIKFDVIKDKGKPIAEDIYIEIWIEDNGKIKNWTR